MKTINIESLVNKIENIEDNRQQHKVKHKLVDIVVIVVLAILFNADIWEEIEDFGKAHKKVLKKFLELPNGIPSHDTMQRVMSIISGEQISKILLTWITEEIEIITKNGLVSIDGKTVRNSGNKNNRAVHIVSAFANGISLGEIPIDQKSNEITAIPKLLELIEVKGQIITIDAMGTQKAIAEKIIEKKADYVLALKGNMHNFFKDVKLYFSSEMLENLSKNGNNYLTQKEYSHGKLITRKYYQTNEIEWLYNKEQWKNLRSIGLIKKTSVDENGEITVEVRYYISSLDTNVKVFEKAVRGHWAIENNLHWHLDVTFREDNNRTLEKNLVLNMNIVRKLCLNILKSLELDRKSSLKRKRYIISMDAADYLPKLLLATQKSLM